MVDSYCPVSSSEDSASSEATVARFAENSGEDSAYDSRASEGKK